VQIARWFVGTAFTFLGLIFVALTQRENFKELSETEVYSIAYFLADG
jgi:hypothetical protein